jgi:hypothetical protein
VNGDTCIAASHWVSSITAGGGTRWFPLLDTLASFEDLDAIYLIRFVRNFRANSLQQ